MGTLGAAVANSDRWRKRILVLLWCCALCFTLILAAVRYRTALDSLWYDFRTYFLPSAKLARQGLSPYAVDGYVYSPLVAWLLAPFSELEPWQRVAQIWTIFSLLCALLAIYFGAAACWSRRARWAHPLVLLFASVTLLYNWPTTLVLWLGQTDLIVLAALCFAAWGATRNRAWAAGLGLALATLVKTWPALAMIWLARRSGEKRIRTFAWSSGIGLFALGAWAAAYGPTEIWAWAQAVSAASSQPHLVSFSASGLGNQLFGPDSASPNATLAVTISVIYALAVVSMLALMLRRPGPAPISLWNTILCVVLLLPVSHVVYFLFALPILWYWFAQTLEHANRWSNILALGVSFTWWMLVFRVEWQGDLTTNIRFADYLVIMVGSLITLVTSGLGAGLQSNDS